MSSEEVDTDELPSLDPTSAPAIELHLPPSPRIPEIVDRSTMPPGIEDSGEWNDPLLEDPMEHAPAWGKNLHERFEALRELVAEAVNPETGIPALRTELVKDLSAWLKPHIDEFMRVVHVQEKAIDTIGQEVDQLKADFQAFRTDMRKRVETLEQWRANTKDRAP